MPTFTLDTNCFIAIENHEIDAPFIRTLVDAHAAGTANVAVVAISASEQQRGDNYSNFDVFRRRLAAIDLTGVEILRPILYFDLTFLDWSLYSSPESEAQERRIHDVLFPRFEFDWQDYCRNHGLARNTLPNHDWRNHKCDVQALWSHIHYGREIFVTSDGNFHSAAKKAALIALGANRIEHPCDAVTIL